MMTLKEMFGKAKTWTKEHKKEITIAVCTAVGGYAIYKVVGGNVFKHEAELPSGTCLQVIGDGTELPIPDLGVGSVVDIWKASDGCVDTIINDLKPTDLGKLGEGLKVVDGFTDESTISAVITLCNDAAEA